MITIRGINGDILTHFDNDVPDGNPYFEPVLTDDMESLVSSFSFSVPLELADTEHLVGLNQVLVKDRQGDLRLFVITDVHEVWTTVGGTLQVNCEDISINEMNNIIVSPFESLNFQDTLTKTFKGSGWTLKYGANWKDVDNTTFKVENYDNMRSVIASIVDTYDCQFKFMAQENQFGEITRVAEVYKSRGNDTGKYFYYDRDLLGIERDINHADIKTAIHPYYTGYDGKTYSLKGFAPANPDPDFKKDKASPLIINREASKLFDDGNSYRIMPYKTEVEGNPELVYREAIKELKKYAEPIYTYSVNVLLLQNMIGWEGEDIDLGDTVWMKERVGNRELGLEARVTAYEYHEDDPSKDVVTFSNFKEIDTTDVPELAERIFIAYANSADGIIDFSTTDSVGKAYMGVYTAAVSTQSTDPSTYSWTRIKGEDGNSAPTLNLTSSQQVMKFKSDGTPDGDQTVIFTALKQNSTETVTWEAIPYKGDTAQPAITLGGTGDVRSLTSADWNAEWTRVQVTVSMGSLKDIQTIVMVSDGATGASGKAIVGYLTNESTTFAASSDGTVTDYGNGDGKFVLYEGTNEVTSGITFARASQVGINLLINDTTGEYKVSNMTTDMAQASVSATYKGITITKFLSFSKSKQGAKGDKGDQGEDGQDGAPAKALTLQADSPVMKFDANDVVVAGQVITFTAVKQNIDSNIAWVATPYKGNTAQPAIALKGTGDVRTLEASMWASGVTTIRVEVSADSFRDFVTIAKVKDGAKGDKGSDGIAGKDGVGIRSTDITYAGSASGTTPPTTGWQTQVPTVPAGQFLWTKTVWTYTDDSTETGYSAAMMGKDGAKGNDGIAGKDGVGIKTTVIEYAVNTSGTVKPTSGWTSTVPNTPQGQYLWTRTTWTYTDDTTEQGFTVARQGNNGQNGTDGIDAYSAILSNEANTFAANPAGVVTDWSTGNGTFMVYRGTTRLTSGVTYAVASSVNATGTINATTGDYSITALGKDNGSITFKATIGSTVLTKTMSLSKARQGVQGVQGTMGIAFYSPTEPTGDNVTEGSTWFKTVSTADDTIAGIYTYKGGSWIKTEVASGALSVEKLSALSADLGDVTAGTITGIDIIGSGFTNPFDFQDVSGNHLEGSTTIESAKVVIDGVTNRGTLGERKFNTSVNPQFFQTVYLDSSDSILTSMNVSPSGLTLNNPVALRTVTVSNNALQILDNTKGTSTWANTNSIGIAQGGSSERAEMGLGGFLYKNRKNVHIWTGTGDQTNSTPNNARLRFGSNVSYGWGISASDNPFKLVQPYIWQVDREIKFEWMIQVSIQDATSDYVYFKMYFKDAQDTDESPQATIHSGRISSANNNSTGVNLRMQNTVFLHGYHKASANQYFSLVTECRSGRNCGNIRILSSAFREMFEE